MKELSYEERLKQAALEGVIMRLENDQPHYVINFLKNCSSPQLVLESKRVKDIAINIFTEGFNHEYVSRFFGADGALKTASDLLRALKIPDTEIQKLILDYFDGYSSRYSCPPRDFENILEYFPLPVDVLSKNKNIEKAVHTEIKRGITSHEKFRRQLCFLKYFTLSSEEKLMLAKRAISDSAFTSIDEPIDEKDLEIFIKELKLNRGEILSILNNLITHFIGNGNIEEARFLVDKYSLDPKIIISNENKKMAVKGVLDHYKNGDSERINEAKQMINTFGLVRADFEDDQLIKTISECVDRYRFESLIELINLADFPNEKIASLINSNLRKIVMLDNKKLLPFLEIYGIGWSEVVEAAKRSFIKGLSSSGGKHLKAYINKFEFSKEFLESDEVMTAAKEGLIMLYKYADHDKDMDFMKTTFGIS